MVFEKSKMRKLQRIVTTSWFCENIKGKHGTISIKNNDDISSYDILSEHVLPMQFGRAECFIQLFKKIARICEKRDDPSALSTTGGRKKKYNDVKK